MAQSHENPDDANVQTLVNEVRKEQDDGLKQKLEEAKNSIPQRARRAIDLSREKGASRWLTEIPCKDMDFDLNKRESVEMRSDSTTTGPFPTVRQCACVYATLALTMSTWRLSHPASQRNPRPGG